MAEKSVELFMAMKYQRPMANLLVSIKAGARSHYPLNKEWVTIGRDADNQIVLDDATVSRRHAAVIIKEGGFLLIDLDSSNGTTINGCLVREAKLSDGDLLHFGEVEARFFEEAARPGRMSDGGCGDLEQLAIPGSTGETQCSQDKRVKPFLDELPVLVIAIPLGDVGNVSTLHGALNPELLFQVRNVLGRHDSVACAHLLMTQSRGMLAVGFGIQLNRQKLDLGPNKLWKPLPLLDPPPTEREQRRALLAITMAVKLFAPYLDVISSDDAMFDAAQFVGTPVYPQMEY